MQNVHPNDGNAKVATHGQLESEGSTEKFKVAPEIGELTSNVNNRSTQDFTKPWEPTQLKCIGELGLHSLCKCIQYILHV